MRMNEKKNNLEWNQNDIGWWCFVLPGKKEVSIQESKDAILDIIGKVYNVVENFFMPHTIDITFGPVGETMCIGNNDGFAFSEIKQILINEVDRLESLGKKGYIVVLWLRGKTNLFVYDNGKIVEKWIPERQRGVWNSMCEIHFSTVPGSTETCVHLSLHSDIFLKKTLEGEDNTELGKLNNKKLEKVLRGFRKAFPDAELDDYASEYLNTNIYEYGFKQ